MEKKKDLLIFLLFVAVTVILFREAIFIRWYHPKINTEDILLYPDILPILRYGPPLWNPYILCGFPLLPESITYTLLSPFTILGLSLQYFFHISNFAAFNFIYILHFPLMGFFMYLYARIIGLNRMEAVISGLIFAFNSYIMVTDDFSEINTYLWSPLILFFLEKALAKGEIDWYYIILTGFFYGILWLGGDPQFAYYFSLLFIFYLFFRYFMRVRKAVLKRVETKQFVFISLLIFIIGIGIFAIQFLPTYELAKKSARFYLANYGRIYKAYTLDKEILKSTLIYNPYRENLFLGAGVIFLIFLPLFFKRTSIYYYFYLLIAIFFLIMSSRYFITKFLYYHLPYFAFFRRPLRACIFFIFSSAILAGFGLKKIKFNWIKVLLIGIILLQIFSVWRKVYKEEYLDGYVALTYPLGDGFLQEFEYELYSGMEKFLSSIKRDEISMYRIFLNKEYTTENIFKLKRMPFSSNGCGDFILLRYLEFTKTTTKKIDRLRQMPWYDFLLFPNFLRLTNTKYVILSKSIDESYHEGTNPKLFIPSLDQSPLFKKIYQDDINQIYLFKDTLPRSFFVTSVLYIKDKQKILDTLKKPTFNPRQTVILEEPIDKFVLAPKVKTSQSSVQITSYLPNKVSISLDAKSPGFLVLSDTYYPGWKAYVNKKPTKIYRANYIFRALYIDKPGHYSIEFVYSPLSVKLGAAITLLTLIGCIGGLVWRRKKTC